MNTSTRTWLLAISAAAILYGTNVHAMNDFLRCPNGLISVGDAQYSVEQKCGTPDSQHTTNTGGQGDQVFYYYKMSNVTEELQFIDGHLYQITDNYN